MSVTLTPVSIVPRKAKNPNDDNTAQISEHLLRELQIEMDREVIFSLGKKRINLKVEPIKIAQNQIYISERIVQEFCLPIHLIKLQVSYVPTTNTLWLGPVIGLLTDFHTNEIGEPHFRSIHLFCEELHHCCLERKVRDSCGSTGQGRPRRRLSAEEAPRNARGKRSAWSVNQQASLTQPI